MKNKYYTCNCCQVILNNPSSLLNHTKQDIHNKNKGVMYYLQKIIDDENNKKKNNKKFTISI